MGLSRRPGYKNFEDVPADLNWQEGEHDTGAKWIDGKRIFRYLHVGVTDADASTTVNLVGLSGLIDKVIPGSVSASIDFSATIVQSNDILDAADMQITILTNVPSVAIAHSAPFQSKPFRLCLSYTVL